MDYKQFGLTGVLFTVDRWSKIKSFRIPKTQTASCDIYSLADIYCMRTVVMQYNRSLDMLLTLHKKHKSQAGQI
jgi:hypothetical protein